MLFGQDEDKRVVKPIICDGRVARLMPNVIDTDAFIPASGEVKKNTAVFVGAMTHQANVDAVMNFQQSTWDKIRERVDGAQLWIVGMSPPQRSRR